MRETQISPEELRAARLAKGLQQKEVAEHLGVTSTSVWRWERGDHVPNDRIRTALVELYGLQVEHDLPETVGRLLIQRMDRLEAMLQEVKDALEAKG